MGKDARNQSLDIPTGIAICSLILWNGSNNNNVYLETPLIGTLLNNIKSSVNKAAVATVQSNLDNDKRDTNDDDDD